MIYYLSNATKLDIEWPENWQILVIYHLKFNGESFDSLTALLKLQIFFVVEAYRLAKNASGTTIATRTMY